MKVFEKSAASKLEQEKLIDELQKLIEVKKLNVKLDVKDMGTPRLQSGCEGCTLCPCMICW